MRLLRALMFIIAFFASLSFGSAYVLAQETENMAEIDAQYPAPEEAPTQEIVYEADKYTFEFNQLKEENRLRHTLGVAVAGMLSLIVMLFFISRSKDYSSQDVIHASGLVFVIFGTIAVVVLADVEQQLTASIGIMGAIAGYLFGRMHDKQNEKDKNNASKGHE